MYPHTPFLFRATLILIGIAAFTSPISSQESHPFEEGLGSLREPTGNWYEAADAILDSDNKKLLKSKPGKGVIINGPDGRTKHIITKAEHGDVQVHVEFLVAKESNSGVYLQGRYEIQVLDSWGAKKLEHADCGGIYQRYIEGKGRGYEGHPPLVNASLRSGEWQSFDITFRAPRFDADGNKTQKAAFVKVVHNGKVVHNYTELTGPTRAAAWFDEKPTGPLMLQGDHGPVAYRNLVITPLDLK